MTIKLEKKTIGPTTIANMKQFGLRSVDRLGEGIMPPRRDGPLFAFSKE